MYPHERSLVQKFQDKHFTIIGVNSDPKAILKRVYESKTISWPSFWDGGDQFGPIAERWNVSGWPTLYLIDAQGVIRSKIQEGDDLDSYIEQLVKEAATAPAIDMPKQSEITPNSPARVENGMAKSGRN